MRVSIWTEAGAASPKSRVAVPSGITTEPSSDAWRATPEMTPTTV